LSPGGNRGVNGKTPFQAKISLLINKIIDEEHVK
jgi:hypothetical protein